MELVFDTGEATFGPDVVEASQTTPILVDFWAAWCGPCKTLTPILERLAQSSGGAFRLAKVDTEKEQRLAAMFQVQSIPYVVAFLGGRPVDAFVGVLDEPKIRDFLSRLGVDLDATPEEKDDDEAENASTLGKASVLLRGRRVDELDRVFSLLREIEEDEDDSTQAERLLAAEPWFADRIAGDTPAATTCRAARAAWLEGDEQGAMQLLLDSVGEDPAWSEELARKAVVALMQLHGEHKEFIAALRRRLAVLLY